ncbi:MAG: CRISPR-associated endonuclease Cas1 [Methanocorpusculum parvum]|nr:CRISPR-associated endonuclease Cas1 [Methanocorpusculum parvum]
MIPWVTVWGYGADISVRGESLFVRGKGAREAKRYALSDVSHLIVAGDNILHTAVISKCAKREIPVSFFDIHGKPEGSLFRPEKPRLSAAQDLISRHAFALSAAEAAADSRMRFLHELTYQHPNLFYQGELDLLTGARSEFEYLITLPELTRGYLLTKNMYYEILSRVVPKKLGYVRRAGGASSDPVNVLFSRGYAVLYATVAAACVGAGLDLNKGALHEKSGACVYDIMEAALVPMVDKAVVKTASLGYLDDVTRSSSRCIISEDAASFFTKELSSSINRPIIEENVLAYAKAVEEGVCVSYHYPA